MQHLPEGEAVQHDSVPLVLQRLEDRWNRGGRRRLWLHQWRTFHLQENLMNIHSFRKCQNQVEFIDLQLPKVLYLYELLKTQGLLVDWVNPRLIYVPVKKICTLRNKQGQ